jgi:ABC-type polar amino acid transport system ATPase subunit
MNAIKRALSAAEVGGRDEQPPSAGPALRVEGLRKSFDGQRLVLDDVGMRVEHGTIVSIIGQSGGGKTTLLRCLNLLERPDSGVIEIDGEPSFSGDRIVCGDLARLRQRVGMVFQRFNLFPHLTAIENVTLAQMKASQVTAGTATAEAVRLLTRVGLAHRALAYPEQMSGGEQQRVAIARALALKPKLLLFDEPTSALDPESTGEVMAVMKELAAAGMTMVLATHDLPFAERVSDRVVFVDRGRVVEEGEPTQVFRSPTQQRTREYVSSHWAESHSAGIVEENGR